MNAANPVILERALSRPPKEAEPQLRGDSVGSDRYTCGDYLQREYQKVWNTVERVAKANGYSLQIIAGAGWLRRQSEAKVRSASPTRK